MDKDGRDKKDAEKYLLARANGLYDSRQAGQFITQRTGETLETAERFLHAYFSYHELNYLVEPDNDPKAARELHADLITNSPQGGPGNEVDNMLLLYIRRVTGLERARVASMIAEETGYMTYIGLTDPAACQISRRWADAISIEEHEAGDADTAH